MPQHSRLIVVASLVALAAACTSEPASQPLPPAGLAGSPAGAVTSIPLAPGTPMPAGHPPIDNPHGGAVASGGDDGAPIAPAGQAPLPNLPGMNSVGGGGGMGGNVVFSGKVLEKLDVPQYTYMRVQTTAGDEWVAVSTMSVNVGDNVTINQQLVMENFASKSLGRTFSKLVMGTASIGG